MKLTNIERETILNFNEGEEIASLYTYNQKLQNRFDKLAQELPALVSRKDNGHGAVTYELSNSQKIEMLCQSAVNHDAVKRICYSITN